jgi:hypothetical protein
MVRMRKPVSLALSGHGFGGVRYPSAAQHAAAKTHNTASRDLSSTLPEGVEKQANNESSAPLPCYYG